MSDYYQQIDLRFSQGDIIELAPHARVTHPLVSVKAAGEGEYKSAGRAGDSVIGELRFRQALLITADCDMDKVSTKFWHICPIFPLSSLNGNDQTLIKKNKRFNFLHLPGQSQLVESFADLSSITTIAKEELQAGNRLTTLSDRGRAAFFLQFTRWVTRWTLAELQCPTCGTTFNPADVLPVRSE